MSVTFAWSDPTYLSEGTARQRQAHAALAKLNLAEVLRPFSPVLCGTIPLGIDIPESDLDVICEARDLGAFERAVTGAFCAREGFTVRRTEKQGHATVICNFRAEGFEFELFAQPRPVTEQNAYRHMVVEARLLAAAGPVAAEAIRRLKAQGMRTEPAFAAYFGLDGDPYERLLALFPGEEKYGRGCADCADFRSNRG